MGAEGKIQHEDGLARCTWPGDDPLYVAYHDEDWGVPEYDDRALWEKLVMVSLAVITFAVLVFLACAVLVLGWSVAWLYEYATTNWG